MDIVRAAVIVSVIVGIGVVAFLVLGWPLVRKLAENAGRLYAPSDKHFRVLPEYSIAEARVQQGRIDEAIEEFRKVIAQHPNDIGAHVRVADLLCQHRNDPQAAERELLAAVAKATSPDAITLTSHRLADLYQHQLQQPDRARAVMEQLKVKLPDGKAGVGADQRIALLQGGTGRAPEARKKIPIPIIAPETAGVAGIAPGLWGQRSAGRGWKNGRRSACPTMLHGTGSVKVL